MLTATAMSAATGPDPLTKQRTIVGHIDTPERSNEPIYAVIPGSNSGDSKLQDLRREEEMARQTYARLLFQMLDSEQTENRGWGHRAWGHRAGGHRCTGCGGAASASE